jgi:hypothetical protein
MKGKDVMNLLLIGAGGYALYWYLNNYGPSGAAFNSAGQQIAATWWSTWFGAPAAAAVSTTTTTNPLTSTSVNTPTAPATTGTGLPAAPVNTTSPANSGPPSPSQVLSNAVTIQSQLQGSANNNAFFQQQGGEGDAYQWATLWNGIGQPAFNVNQIFYPNGFTAQVGAPGMSQQGLPLISLATFLSNLQSAGISTGMSGVGSLRGVIQLPSFSGGGKGFSGAFKGARGNKEIN